MEFELELTMVTARIRDAKLSYIPLAIFMVPLIFPADRLDNGWTWLARQNLLKVIRGNLSIREERSGAS